MILTMKTPCTNNKEKIIPPLTMPAESNVLVQHAGLKNKCELSVDSAFGRWGPWQVGMH